ncbi:monocarboxylate transporter 6 isoform X1 [Sardina pilchardus]|uniref:monocarboxylate transporter 6 isoform X1 n=1 Tax=Sardina pilchardus TaxID=27697 RepID=UPI002E0FDED9
MTEGLEVHQKESPRSAPSNGQSTLVRRSSPDARQSHKTWSWASSLRSVDSALDAERVSDSEERDGQEGAASGEPVAPCDGEEPERLRQSGAEAPDGGWGWVVVASTILVLALTLAFPSCMGIFYTDLQTEFNTTNTETSWVPAIMTAVLHGGAGKEISHVSVCCAHNDTGWQQGIRDKMKALLCVRAPYQSIYCCLTGGHSKPDPCCSLVCFAGPLCSVLVELFGCRPVVMLGGVLSGLGMMTSSFARSITALYLTAGILTGLGFCFSFQPAITMIGHYFVRRRAFANALSSTGTALGLCVLPLLANFLRGYYGWRGSFLIFGGILLNCCVCGAVLRPLQASARRGSRGQQRRMLPEEDHANGGPRQGKPEGLKVRLRATLSSLMAFLHRHMGFDLLRSNPRYRAFSLSVSWMMLGFTVPLVYLVPYATSHGISQDRAALLMSILGLVNIFVRPVVALVFGLPRFRGSPYFVYMFGAAILLNGLSNSVCGMAATFPVLLAFVVLFGLSMSFIGSLLVTVLMDTVDMRRFHSALGLICCMESVTVLMGPPLAGLLMDRTGHYTYIFYACSVNVASAGLFLMASFYYLDRQRNREARSCTPPAQDHPLRPVISLSTSDVAYSQVPLKTEQAEEPADVNVSDV